MKRLIITNPTSSKGIARETTVLKVKTKPTHSIIKLVSLSKLMGSRTYTWKFTYLVQKIILKTINDTYAYQNTLNMARINISTLLKSQVANNNNEIG